MCLCMRVLSVSSCFGVFDEWAFELIYKRELTAINLFRFLVFNTVLKFSTDLNDVAL